MGSFNDVKLIYVAHQVPLSLKLPSGNAQCRNYLILKRLFSCIDAPIAYISDAFLNISNMVLKAFVLNNTDRERELGCLRRKEKLSSKS